MMDADDKAKVALAVAQECSAKLAGLGREVQGAVLAELTSMWLAGHRPDVREGVWKQHQKAIRDFTKINAKRLPWGR